MKTSAQASIGTIDRFIQEVGVAEKTAADKVAADPKSEPGSIGGETSHPVKSVDDRLQEAPKGARSKENTADVKEDQGKPSVESAPEATSEGTKKAAALDLSRFAKPMAKKAEEGKSSGGAVQTPGSAADDHLQIGTKKAPTGDDPAVETNSAKSGKEDPGSSHPARTDNDQLDGHKFSADQLATLPFSELLKAATDLSNAICADLATEQVAPAPAATTKQAADSGLDTAALAAQAGWELAGLLTGDFDKAAADAMVRHELEAIIKTASDDADNVGQLLTQYYAEKAAAAGGPPTDPSADPAAMMMPPGGGSAMGGEMGGPQGGPGGGEDAMLAAMGGAGGGDEMGGAMGGGDEMGGQGGPGGAPDEQALQLAQILEELGVTPEELEAAMAQAGEGGGEEAGGDDLGGGEEMGDEESGDEAGMAPAGAPKFGADKRARKTTTKTAGVKKGNAVHGVREYITEVIQRSRRGK